MHKIIKILVFLLLVSGIFLSAKPKRVAKSQVRSLPNINTVNRRSVFLNSNSVSSSVIDTLLNESFEGDFPGWSQIDGDQDGNVWGLDTDDEAPVDTFAHTGDYGLSILFNMSGNDDWLFTPNISLPSDAETITFSFWARSYSSYFAEDFNVKMTTDTNAQNTDAFTITLGEVRDVPGEWTKYTYDLTDYAGESIILSVQCVSEDDFYLIVDDFLVTAELSEEDEWSQQYLTKYNTEEADLTARTGDIDNLGFGWPDNFDPFSGESTPVHYWPWDVDPEDAEGTDRIMVVSSYTGNNTPAGSDGYSTSTSRPENDPRPITVSYDLQGTSVNSAALQIFVDDFQAPVWQANYQVTIDDVRVPFLEDVINSLSQTGPVGKLISVNIPNEYLQYFNDGQFSIFFDDSTTGAGDGYAIDFVKILINPNSFTYTGTITGTVINSDDDSPIEGATVTAGGIIDDVTNSAGEFTLSSVPAGLNYIEVSADGYQLYNTNVDLQSGETENISVELIPELEIPDMISTEYGPPASANTWEQFAIPLTAESFDVESNVFDQVMQSVDMIRIRTEMHTGDDEGGLDNVTLGNLYSSNFDNGTENWSAMGDGTMSWSSSGGVSGGYITISDWASGDYHYAVAPDEWTGNLSDLIGQNLEFYSKTDHPSYSAYVEIYTGTTHRIVLSANKQVLEPGEAAQIEVSLIPAPAEDITIELSASNSSITIPYAATLSAGNSTTTIMAQAAEDITEDTESVITVSASGYSTSRLTLQISANQSQGSKLTGQVTDATNGEPIEGATVTVADLSDITDSNGNYEISNVPMGELAAAFSANPTSGTTPLTVNFTDNSTASSQTVTATAEGYSDYVNENFNIIEAGDLNLDISLSPELTEGNMRLVLNWDDDPRDLDSHLYTPEIEGTSYHILYNNQGSSESAPYAVLDHDDTDGYGPETITIHEFQTGYYHYYVHKYAGVEKITESSGVVQIYNQYGLLETIQAPTAGEGDYWHVCDINGDNQNITIVNEILDTSPVESNALAKTTSKTKKSNENYITANINTWNWDFGDGNTSDEQNPTHVYNSAGSYTVTLEIGDGTYTDTKIRTDYITVSGGSEDSLTSNWSFCHPTPTTNSIYDAQLVSSTTGFACGGKGTILKTSNGGDDWQLLSTITQETLSGIHFVNESTGFVSGNNYTIIKTTDGGQSWQDISIQEDYQIDIFDIYFLSESTGFIIGRSGTLRKTSNGGASWEWIDVPDDASNRNLSHIYFLEDNTTGFIVGSRGTILKTTDSGETWSLIDSPVDKYLLKIFFLDENTGWIAGNSNTVLKTTDGGDTWTYLSEESYTPYDDIYFTDSNTGYLLTESSIKKSTDGGQNWETLVSDYDYSFSNFLTYDFTNVFIYAQGGHFIKSSDNWQNYAAINSQTANIIEGIDFIDSNIGFTVDRNGTILRTSNRGEDWEIGFEAAKGLYAITHYNSDKIIAVGASGSIVSSEDYGENWTETRLEDENLKYETFLSIEAVNSSIYYAVGTDGAMIKSSDGGQSWSPLNPNYVENLNDITFIDQNNGFAVGGKYGEAKILKTTDGGNTWNDVTTPIDNELESITFLNSSTGFAIGSDAAVIKTTDGGASWQEVEILVENSFSSFHDIQFFDENRGIIVGASGLVYLTEDGGDTWQKDESFIGDSWLNDVHFLTANYGFVVGMHGSILKYQDGTVAIEESNKSIAKAKAPENYKLKQNYPNPFNPTTTIVYEIPKENYVYLAVYDIAGHQIDKLVADYKKAGRHSVIWNAKDVPSGVYIVRLHTNNYTSYKKMMLLK